MMDTSNVSVYGDRSFRCTAGIAGSLMTADERGSRTIIRANLRLSLTAGDCLHRFVETTFGAVAHFGFVGDGRSTTIRFYDLPDAQQMRMCYGRSESCYLQMVYSPQAPVVNEKAPPNNGTPILDDLGDGRDRAEIERVFRELDKFAGSLRPLASHPRSSSSIGTSDMLKRRGR
jgi:hypothetical protein